MFRNIQTVKHIDAQSLSWRVALMDIENISNHYPFIKKPTEEIHEKQAPKYDLNK